MLTKTGIKIISKADAKHYDKNELLDVTNRSTNWGRKLSPSTLGPSPLYNYQISQTMENAWNYAHVYQCHVDEFQEPTNEYFKWAESGWHLQYESDSTNFKDGGPLQYIYWNGEKLDEITARKRIYAPLYAKAAMKTKEFQRLLHLYENDKMPILVDYDGYNHQELGMSLLDALECPDRIFGHAFVLAMLLENPKLREKYAKA